LIILIIYEFFTYFYHVFGAALADKFLAKPTSIKFYTNPFGVTPGFTSGQTGRHTAVRLASAAVCWEHAKLLYVYAYFHLKGTSNRPIRVDHVGDVLPIDTGASKLIT